MIRLLVADDHPAFRRGLELMLVEVDDLEVVAMAETGARAVELAGSLAPDVVLMDLRMPDVDGIEATRRINRGAPAPPSSYSRCLRTTTLFSPPCAPVLAAISSRGQTRTRSSERSVPRQRARQIFGPEVAARVISHFAQGAGSSAAAFPSLTEREREVLEMIAAGKGNATIAHELVISLKTVRNHVSNIFTKLQVSDRSGAIVKARKARLGGD